MPDTPSSIGWKICCAAAVITMVLAFTPLLLPTGSAGPFWLGMPYALWSGIALCGFMVMLTAIATVVHPGGGGAGAGAHPQKR